VIENTGAKIRKIKNFTASWPFRAKSPKNFHFPPREGSAFLRRKTSCMKRDATGKAEPFREASGEAAGRTPLRES
jgi:hypothetical protein